MDADMAIFKHQQVLSISKVTFKEAPDSDHRVAACLCFD